MDTKLISRHIQQARASKYGRWYALGLPVFLAILYFGFVASDYYESISTYTVQAAQGGASVSGLESILGMGTSLGSDRDVYAVQDYLLSRDALRRLDREHGFRRHYQGGDWISRLSPWASFEDTFDYYLDVVSVEYDTITGVTTLSVKARTAEKAQELAKALLKYGEEIVNRLSERARTDQMLFARREVRAAENRLAKAREKIVRYQWQGEDINPLESATAVFKLRSELEAELAKAKAELQQMSAFMRKDSHRMVALKEKIKSLEAQIAHENKRLVNDSGSSSLSLSISLFEPLMVEKEFAEKAYETALAAMTVATTEAAKQQRYLATVAAPSLPDEAAYPRRWLNILTVLVLTLFAYGIGTMVHAAVMEHLKL